MIVVAAAPARASVPCSERAARPCSAAISTADQLLWCQSCAPRATASCHRFRWHCHFAACRSRGWALRARRTGAVAHGTLTRKAAPQPLAVFPPRIARSWRSFMRRGTWLLLAVATGARAFLTAPCRPAAGAYLTSMSTGRFPAAHRAQSCLAPCTTLRARLRYATRAPVRGVGAQCKRIADSGSRAFAARMQACGEAVDCRRKQVWG